MKHKDIEIIASMMTGDYKKRDHTHKCAACGDLYPHDVDDCKWPAPWYCPDCEDLDQYQGYQGY